MDLIKGNEQFLDELDSNKDLKQRRDALVKGQHPDGFDVSDKVSPTSHHVLSVG